MPLDEVGRYYARILVDGEERRVYEGQTVTIEGVVELIDDLPSDVIVQGKGHGVKTISYSLKGA